MPTRGHARDLELTYQADRATRAVTVGPTPDFVVERYRRHAGARLFVRECLVAGLGDLGGKRILDFGCGEGELSTLLARLGGTVSGIDISPDLIDLARRRARLDGVEDRVEFTVGDIVDRPFAESTFDIAICNAVLHHVDIGRVLPLIRDAVAPGGLIAIVEPVAFSPLLQRVRDLVPVEKDASPGERQLDRDDVEFVQRVLPGSRATYFQVLGRLERLFPNRSRIDKGHRFTRSALVLLNWIDRLLLSWWPSLSKFAAAIVIVGRKEQVGREAA